MEPNEITQRFDWLGIGRLFIHVYSHTLVRMYEKKSLSSAYDLDPLTLKRTGNVVVFSRTTPILAIAT